MAGLFKDVVDYFKADKIDIDNWTFKLFSKLSIGIFMLASATSLLKTFFGDPIKCLDLKDKGYGDTYCWLHGSYHISNRMLGEQVNKGDHCFRPTNRPDEEGTPDSDTDYYVWIPVMFLFHAILFKIPDRIWKHLEGGVMDEFKSIREKSIDDAAKHADSFRMQTKNQNNRYFFTFIFCEFLNLVAAGFNFAIMDKFLSGNFFAYGKKVVQYYFARDTLDMVTITYTDTYGRQIDISVHVNPMCVAFPTMVSCNVETIGKAGGASVENHICILTQNVIYEKLYVLLWFWFLLLFVASSVTLIYRLATTVLPQLRKRELKLAMRTKHEQKLGDLEILDEKRYGVGGWFILCQIGRNSTPYYFRRLLQEVAKGYLKEEMRSLNEIEDGECKKMEMDDRVENT